MDWHRVRDVASRRFQRATKALTQWLDLPDDLEPRPLFVLGCQRSGTTMMIDTLMKSAWMWSHPEKGLLAYNNYRLRSPTTIAAITQNTPAAWAVYKPLCDAHLGDRILDHHPDGYALWMYRRFEDVANSSVRKWGDHHAQMVRAIAAGDWEQLGWRGERLPPRLIAQCREVVTDDLSPEAGAAMFWYLRNSFFFSLELDRHDRVALLRYEDLVQDPAAAFPRLFGHLSVPFDPAYIAEIRPSSVGRSPFPEIPQEIRALCEALTERLDAHYTATWLQRPPD